MPGLFSAHPSATGEAGLRVSRLRGDHPQAMSQQSGVSLSQVIPGQDGIVSRLSATNSKTSFNNIILFSRCIIDWEVKSFK